MKKFLFALFTLFTVNSYADCPGMTVTLTMYNPSCAGSCDGYGYTSVSGGSGNYNYFYQDASTGASVGNQVNDSIYGLCAGNYRVIVHDITNACFDTTLFSMTAPMQVVATVITNQNVTCFGGSDGQLTVVATGGTGVYAYVWSNGATTPTIMGPAGVYTVTVYDANGCSTFVTGLINEPPQLIASANSTPASCGVCDGTLNASVTGGTPGYTYMWQPSGSTAPNVVGQCAGSYQLTVVDVNGCMVQTGGVINTASSIVVTATSTPSGCNPCDGTISVMQSGGTGPYTYSIDNGITTQTTANFTGVCAGAYIATVTDAQGCMGFYTIVVNSNGIPGLTVADSIQNETGTGSLDGSIDLTLSGSTGPYTYTWSNGATTEDIYSLTGGSYTVMISDSNGDCISYTFTVGTTPSYGYITGNFYFDNNQNCVFDGTDYPMANQYVMATNGTNIYYGYTNATGDYQIWTPSGNYTVAPWVSTNLTVGCTASYNVNVTNGNTISGNNFSYYQAPFYDVCVSTYSAGIVPGFNGTYYIYLSNVGNQAANGSVCITLPAPLTFVTSTPAATSVTGNVICIDYIGLAGGSTAFYTITFYTPPTLALGTPMVACVNATVTNGTDVNPSCNNYCYTRIVSGSFDPNDKTASPAGENATGDVLVAEDEFTYLVRFQNTGTGPAVNITVTDTLTAMLDPLSFEMLNASHPYTVEFINGNIIKWRFENIMLPDSGSNEPGSHGHIQFRLNTANTPVVGQVIENRANIYFDFNEPVITNTAINTFVAPNGMDEMDQSGNFSIYPNPTENLLHVQSEKGNAHYTIYDVTGKVNFTQNSIGANSTLDISALSSGVYFIRCISGEEVSTIKFIKK